MGSSFVLVTEYVDETIAKLKLGSKDRGMISESFKALHDVGVVHGDIRPENISRLQRDKWMHMFSFIYFG